MRKLFLLGAAGMLFSAQSPGGSFQLNLQGLRQTAMGGSGTAFAWDASTLFFNPAGLSRLQGTQVYAGGFAVAPRIRYTESPAGEYIADNQPRTSVPFAIYAGGHVGKSRRVGIGMGIYTPFGSSIRWEDNWTGRYIVQSISLSSIFFQPTVSYRITERISAGAGIIYAAGSMNITRAMPVQDINGNEGRATLQGNAGGAGFNLGIQAQATERLYFGLSYRSGVNMKLTDGEARFNVPASVQSGFPSTTFSTQLPLPSILTLGAAYQASEKLFIQADIVLAGWSRYHSLDFDFAENTPSLQDSRNPRAYKNTLAYRLGMHYKLCSRIALMAGGSFDPTPSDNQLLSPDAVDADRISASCGITYEPVSRLSVMAALHYTTTPERTASYTPAAFTGAYQIKSLIPALGVSYRF